VDGHERDDRLTDRERLARTQGELRRAYAVEVGPVRAPEILDAHLPVLKVHLGVAARGLRIAQPDVPRLATERDHRCAEVPRLGRLVRVLDLEDVVGSVRHVASE
jgi:hypothetical protein